jgi:hypothetical protein
MTSTPPCARARANLIANEHVKLALRVTNVGSGRRETAWDAEGNVGVSQFGSLTNGEYFPLYQLQTVQTKSLSPSLDGGETMWVAKPFSPGHPCLFAVFC